MIWKVFLVAVVVVLILIVGLGLKQLLKPNSKPVGESCALESGELDKDDACAKCKIKDLVDCPENKQSGSSKQS